MFKLHSGPPPTTRTAAKAVGLPVFRCVLACPKCRDHWRKVTTGQCVGCLELARRKADEERQRANRRATAPARAAATRKRNGVRRLKEAEAIKRRAERAALQQATPAPPVVACSTPLSGDPWDAQDTAAPWD